MIRAALTCFLISGAVIASAASSDSEEEPADSKEVSDNTVLEPSTGLPDVLLDRMRAALIRQASETIGTSK
ncbi:hypothetical protein [Roseivivax sp. CAU 1753]